MTEKEKQIYEKRENRERRERESSWRPKELPWIMTTSCV